MAVQYNNNSSISYGFEQGLIANPPFPIIAKRDPTANDGNAAIGTLWINKLTNGVFFLTSIVGNVSTWASTAGGGEIVTSITATTGPNSLTGATTINTTGAATTTIGTGGTGAVQIGNTTGNTSVTGSLTASTGLTATTGDVAVTAGNVTFGNINGSIRFYALMGMYGGIGAPTFVAGQGSLYLRRDGSSTTTRLYVNTDGNTAWTSVTTAT